MFLFYILGEFFICEMRNKDQNIKLVNLNPGFESWNVRILQIGEKQDQGFIL